MIRNSGRSVLSRFSSRHAAGLYADISVTGKTEKNKREVMIMSEEKKHEILEEKLDENELDAVSGGIHHGRRVLKKTNLKPDERNYCSGVYYAEKCKATVESGSWCGSNDRCMIFSEQYTIERSSE